MSDSDQPIDSDLAALGWDDRWEHEFAAHRTEGLLPGRVVAQHRGEYDVVTDTGQTRAAITGRLGHRAAAVAALPVVGDWVVLQPLPESGTATITAVLPRRTRFSRKAAADAVEEQVLCANLDVVFVVTSANEDLNLRRLERYLTLAGESGAAAIIVLTKIDLVDDVRSPVTAIRSVSGDVPIVPVSVPLGIGVDEVLASIGPRRTAALLGSSGVGKSTLVNTLAGRRVLATASVRDDGKGRHTTTHRQLVALPDGSLLVDTPGMREVQLWEAAEGLDEAFPDITALAATCRFADCGHVGEPGCAVAAALEAGELALDRWGSYLALEGEIDRVAEQRVRQARRPTGRRPPVS